jgi:uncharacterized protein
MNAMEFSLMVWLGSLSAGFFGSLTGLGGGVVIVPLPTLLFGVDIRYAIGASLVSVIATSSGAASAYVREGYSNLRIGMFLEIATTIGALSGAFLAARLSPSPIAIVFGVVLLYSAYQANRARRDGETVARTGALAGILRMDSSYPTPEGPKSYGVQNVAGVLGGSMLGARILPRIRTRTLRIVFGAIVAVLGAERIYNGWTGRI